MSTSQYATFYVNDALCGTNILQIREVIKDPVYSPVPQAPFMVEGLMNLRGQIVTVINMAKSLGLAIQTTSLYTTCIILKTDEELAKQDFGKSPSERIGPDGVGLLVSDMGEVIDIDEDDIDAPPANTPSPDKEYILGVAKLKDELMTIVSLKKILNLNKGNNS